jgi:hypothetical protein
MNALPLYLLCRSCPLCAAVVVFGAENPVGMDRAYDAVLLSVIP